MKDKKSTSTNPAGNTMAVAASNIEPTRSNFKSLIMGNPNYFGNLANSGFKAVKKLASNTNYEELSSIGYNPETRRLFATFDIKRASGYAGDLCDIGTSEYVRFYVNFGSGWQDVGVGANDVHDIPIGKDCANDSSHPLSYSVELAYAPPKKWCNEPQLPLVRAILSWNTEPPANNPAYQPVYGNVKECSVQIAKSISIKDFIKVLPENIHPDLLDSLSPILAKEDLTFPNISDLPELPYPGPTAVELEDEVDIQKLVSIYSNANHNSNGKLLVEPKRFILPLVKALQLNSVNDVSAITSLSSALKKVDINFDDLITQIEDTTGNINYEELVDLALDGNREKLTATYVVKQESGFSGSLCSKGSTQYVSFWADWNNECEWDYLDTLSVKSYDFAQLPDGGLCYTVALPVDLQKFKRQCKDPKIARIRAVLSWNTPPSTTKPNELPTYGNRLDAHVLIPRKVASAGHLTIVGGISTEFINNSDGRVPAGSKFAYSGLEISSPSGQSCPFGGLIIIKGPALDGRRYRLTVLDSAAALQTLNEKIWVTPDAGGSDYHTSDADGWFNYLPYEQNFEGILGYFRSSGEDLVEIQLEIEGDGIVDTQKVQLDNTKPHVEVSITEPGGDCSLFAKNTTIKGKIVATDANMGSWNVVIDGGPAGFGPVTVIDGGSGNHSTPSAGSTWTFDTDGLVQCGYVVRVAARDRAIVNSTNQQHHNTTDVGFAILE